MYSHPVRGLIPVDTLLITGRDDGCVTTDMYDEELDNIFVNGIFKKTVRLSGGHYIHYESPKEFNQHVIQFLSRRPSKA